MTKEHREKIMAGKAARKAKLSGQTINIDKTWSISRIDQYNWQISENGKCPDNRDNYYGTLLSAFLAIPEKAIRAALSNKNSLAEVVDNLKGLREDILKAIESLKLPKGT